MDEKIGHIDHLMIDKQSGHVAYAVMNFGGFLGMGEEAHPVPWNALRYDTDRGGYVTGDHKEQLEGAPSRSDDWRDDTRLPRRHLQALRRAPPTGSERPVRIRRGPRGPRRCAEQRVGRRVIALS